MTRLDGPVLITGCTGGIGAATAARLAKAGMTVYATARHSSKLSELAVLGCRTMDLDVTDEQSMQAAVDAIAAEHGHVAALVNNAGYGEYGAVEEVPLQRVRAQFETNVFGLVRLCQLVLPGMRAAGGGRIVNMSSMGGRIVFPLGGFYHATKHAVEALSDALRFEVAPFGVRVVLIEPGLIRTGFGATAGDTLSTATADDGPYGSLAPVVDKQMASSYASALATGPDTVAAAVQRALTARRPRHRYVVTAPAKALVHTRRLLGSRRGTPTCVASSEHPPEQASARLAADGLPIMTSTPWTASPSTRADLANLSWPDGLCQVRWWRGVLRTVRRRGFRRGSG